MYNYHNRFRIQISDEKGLFKKHRPRESGPGLGPDTSLIQIGIHTFLPTSIYFQKIQSYTYKLLIEDNLFKSLLILFSHGN